MSEPRAGLQCNRRSLSAQGWKITHIFSPSCYHTTKYYPNQGYVDTHLFVTKYRQYATPWPIHLLMVPSPQKKIKKKPIKENPLSLPPLERVSSISRGLPNKRANGDEIVQSQQKSIASKTIDFPNLELFHKPSNSIYKTPRRERERENTSAGIEFRGWWRRIALGRGWLSGRRQSRCVFFTHAFLFFWEFP